MFTRSEKIIIGIMIAAIVLAAMSFFIGEPAEAMSLPLVTLIQEEPTIYENTVFVGQENEVNVEKFSNPALRSGDEQTTTTNNKEEGTSSAVVSTTESETLNRETVTSSSLHDHTTTHTDGLPVERLTKSKGIHQGPSGLESWYDLPMGGVVKIMRGLGFSEEEYPYWVREDGCKMLGDYIMVATSFDIRPRGTVVETSLGLGLACDTGSFAKSNPTQIDIAVSWGN